MNTFTAFEEMIIKIQHNAGYVQVVDVYTLDYFIYYLNLAKQERETALGKAHPLVEADIRDQIDSVQKAIDELEALKPKAASISYEEVANAVSVSPNHVIQEEYKAGTLYESFLSSFELIIVD